MYNMTRKADGSQCRLFPDNTGSQDTSQEAWKHRGTGTEQRRVRKNEKHTSRKQTVQGNGNGNHLQAV